MPPKKPFNITVKPCSARSKTALSTYIDKNIESILLPFAYALKQKGYLVHFGEQTECIFSYNNSLWHSVYLINSQTGEQYWDQDGMKGAKLYFKLGPTGDGGAEIVAATTTTPPELIVNGVEIPNCSISSNRTCVVGKSSEPKQPKQPKEKKKVNDVPVPGISEIMRGVEQINLNNTPKTTHERKFFENFANKTLLVNWMVENMEYSDVLKCIKRGGLSQEDISKAESIGQSGNIIAGPSNASDIDIINASIQQYPARDINSIIKRVTSNVIKDRIKSVSDPKDKQREIIKLCKRSGIPNVYSIKGGKLTRDGVPVNINRVIGECSEAETVRLRRYISNILTNLSKNRQSPQQRPLLSKKELTTGDSPITAEYFRDVAIAYPNPTIKDLSVKDGLVHGKYLLPSGKYSTLKPITSKDLRIWSKNNTAFGKKISFAQRNVRLKFALAAKKCKGTKNYKNCIKNTLLKK